MSDERNIPPTVPPSERASVAELDGWRDDDRRPPRVHRLRFVMILLGLVLIAGVSTIFGMMMAVASDLPGIENRAQYRDARNSVLVDIRGRTLGVLTGKENKILVNENQISASMKHAVIAIEDRRFYEHDGVDFRGIARALWADVAHRSAVQGASTIPQQFVKNALAAQHHRTLFEKLREAALAYHLTRKWSKQKILTEYLNTVYFGNGAYGIESAARTYWQSRHPGCGTQELPCASQLTPAESALIAGVIASPSAYDPIAHPEAGRRRQLQVLGNMRDQGYLTETEYEQAVAEPPLTRADMTYPHEESRAPYFTTWVKQQIVDKLGAQAAFTGGLRIRTTLDLDLQHAAEQAVHDSLPSDDGPRAALVAIDNYTGEVRAMVGGDDYGTHPFNLATQGQRQPGSSFKPFVLAEALEQGISPDSVWTSAQQKIHVPHSAETFTVNNYEGDYTGTNTLAGALTVSDNSIFAQVGVKVGTAKIAHLARRMGIRTPVSTNYAIALGGLHHGVTALDMAHAYETIAEGGKRISGSLGAPHRGPVGIRDVWRGKKRIRENERITHRELPESVAETTASIMQTVVTSGTGRAAALDGEVVAGKTGTTENYGDAWFVGFTKKYTVAVWVGYPDHLVPMKTEYYGGPVSGGTFPADIFHDFMTSVLGIEQQRRDAAEARRNGTEVSSIDSTSSDEDSGGGSDAETTSGTDSATGETTTAAPDDAGDQAGTGQPTGDANAGAGTGTGGGGGDTGAANTIGGDTGAAGGGGGGDTGGGGGGDTGAAGGGETGGSGGGGSTGSPAPVAPTPATPAPSTGGDAGGGTSGGGAAAPPG